MTVRSLHKWVGLATAAPFILVAATGVLLASRSFLPWIDPGTSRPFGRALRVSFDQVLIAATHDPRANIRSWDDVSQIDIRPDTGLIRVRSKTGHWEVQVDGSSGAVLSVGRRRVGWITSIHQGALFGPAIRYGIFLPTGVATLILAISGVVLWTRPKFVGTTRKGRTTK